MEHLGYPIYLKRLNETFHQARGIFLIPQRTHHIGHNLNLHLLFLFDQPGFSPTKKHLFFVSGDVQLHPQSHGFSLKNNAPKSDP